MNTYPYPILNTITDAYQTPFFCGFIDISRDVREQKKKICFELSKLCKSPNPLKASEENYKKQDWENAEIGPNAVIYKIPKGLFIIDTDDQTADDHIRSLYFDGGECLETAKFPSISCALGVKEVGYHYYFVSEDGFQQDPKVQFRNKPDPKKPSKYDKCGCLDILTEGNDLKDEKPSGWVIEYIDNDIPNGGKLMTKKLYLQMTNGWIYESDTDKSEDETTEEISEYSDELEPKFRNIEVWRKYCELLPNETIDRKEWLSLAKFFKKYFDDEGYELFQIWSEKWTGHNERNDREMWRSLKHTKTTVGTPIKFMKDWAPEALKIWLNFVDGKTGPKPKATPLGKEPKTELSPFFIDMDTIKGGIYDMAEQMKNEIRKKAVYCLDSWYIFNDETKLWMTGKVQPTTIIAQTVKKYFLNSISLISSGEVSVNMKEEEAIKFYIEQKKKLDTPSATSQFTAHLRTLVLDNEFKKKLNQTRGKVVYKNGIYDIATNTLRAGIFYDDFLTFTLPFNYIEATPEDKQRVQEILMKTNSQDAEKYEYYIKMLGYSMTGYADREQCAFFLNGASAGNGKSLLFESLSARMVGYVKKLQSDAFERDNSKRHKQFNDIDSSRILWVNEVSQKQQDVSFIKDISDGVPFKNEVMYGTEKEIDVQAKVFFVSNGEPKFASDEGIRRRYRYVEFCSKFFDDGYQMMEYTRDKPDQKIHYIRDKTAPDFLKSDEGMSALLSIIYDGARLYLRDGLKPPARYEELKENAIRANNGYADFMDNFEPYSGHCISKTKLQEHWEGLYGPRATFRMETCIQAFREKGFIYDCKKQVKVNGRNLKGAIMDIKFIESNEDEEDE